MLIHASVYPSDELLALPVMVHVKGGCFMMGDSVGDGKANETPAHEVCLDDFFLSEIETTQLLWQQIMGNNPSRFNDCKNCPVDMVSWNDVQTFIEKLNQITSNPYRLPTEAEWEYAARSAGKQQRWAGTNNDAKLKLFAWYGENSNGRPQAVKAKQPNTLGLYDMTGNVWEWVQDWYDNNYYQNSPKPNPKGPDNGDSKVLRGGSYFFSPMGIRTTVRATSPPDHRFFDIGFRLAISGKGNVVVFNTDEMEKQ